MLLALYLVSSSSTHRSQSAPSATELAVDHDRGAGGVAAYHDFDELAEIGEVRGPFGCNGDPRVSQLDILSKVSALCHHVFEHHDVITLYFLPDGYDRPVRRLGVQQESNGC